MDSDRRQRAKELFELALRYTGSDGEVYMSLVPGTRLGPYEILALIGAGGMGEVYKARDTRLHRAVAIKTLPVHHRQELRRKRRFAQEARAIAALSHPHICVLYDVDQHDNIDFLVMEYLEGETLEKRLARSLLPIDEILRYAIEIAEALDNAHRQGIVHRDLKPSNVMLTRSGVKLLDFGLARLRPPVMRRANATPPTDSATADGKILGTLPYMAPEQLTGGQGSEGSDIFAFGAVLYEMCTGQRAFQGETQPNIIAAILERDPPSISGHQPQAPLALDHLVRRCLAKNLEERWASVHDLCLQLRWIREKGWSMSETVSRHSGPRCLAVLPLANLSGDAAQDYFAEGMTDELIGSLMKLGGVRVCSRTSVIAYKDVRKPLRDIAHELSADWVVEGAVLQSGTRVRITARLLEVASEMPLWSDTYERDLREVLVLQSAVASEIARRVSMTVVAPLRSLARPRAVDPDAYDAYLRGRYFWSKRTRDGLYRAIEYFRSAVDKDPTYAPAHAGLADTYALLSTIGFDLMAPREAMPRAKAAAVRALEIDDTMGQAHASLGYVKLSYEWDWSGAEDHFKRAISCNPAYATAHHWYGHYLLAMGRLEAAIAEMQRALELDPLSVPCNLGLGWSLYYARQYDDAIAQYQRTLDIAPDLPLVRYELGLAYQNKRCYDDAFAAFEKGYALSQGEPAAVMLLGHLNALTGKLTEARKYQARLHEMSKQRYVPPLYTAFIHAGEGATDEAFKWFDRAHDERSNYLIFLAVEPSFDPLRSHPRYAELLQRIGLNQTPPTG